jgi:membrane-associated PAP2 superfamily phosphatase
MAAIVTLAALTGLKPDLQIAQLFFDPVSRRFLGAANPYVGMLREHGYVAIVTCAGVAVAALVTKMLRPPRRTIPGRAVLFLVSTLALGPGLVVNGVFKEHWHRPRPVQVTEFGGSKPYVDWWNPTGTCERNCSFVSGEASAAAWMFAPAMLAPPQWRAAAFAAASIFTLVISVSRMAAGGHFLSDVIFAVLMTLIVLLVMHRVIFRWRRTAAVPA